MDAWQDPDLYRAASHQNAFAHLPGPFAAGAAESKIAVDNAGRIHVDWNPREPVLLIAPAAPLDNASLQVAAKLNPDGANTPLPTLQFAPYTEAGAFLCLYVPPVDPDTHTAVGFTAALQVSRIQADGTKKVLAGVDVGNAIQVSLVEGVLGRMACLMLQEKSRLRRQAREIAASRRVLLAHDDSLDRMGAELGVVRFNDNLIYDKAANAMTTVARREPDDEYRRRIALYRNWMLPNGSGLLNLLNGPGTDADPNVGLFAGLGLRDRFQIIEDDNPFAVAVHIVEKGLGGLKGKFLNYLRTVHLVWPANSPAANNAHNGRYLPKTIRDSVNQLRERLRKAFQFGDDMTIAPMLAGALDRVAACRIELGDATLWKVQRAQDSTAGSRYELGLGLDLAVPTPAVLDQMVNKLKDKNRKAAKDSAVEALLVSMKPTASANDPEGRWLLRACGLRTVHRTSQGSIYLSHLPTFGLVITESPWTADALPLQALYQAPGDPGSNAVLLAGMAAALQQWQAAGQQPWMVLGDAAARAQWGAAINRAPGDHALGVFRSAGLPALQNPGPTVAELKQIASELLITVRLPANLEAQVLTGDPAQAADAMAKVAAILKSNGLNSVLPLVSGPQAGPNQVLLVVGVIGLPAAGLNLSERRSTGFRWYAVPLIGPGGAVRTTGSRSLFSPASNGVTAIVTLGYARQTDKTDPYEYRIQMKEGANLNLLQYEYLMNFLDHTCPAGVEVNTYSIRQQHVDLEADGKANPLPPGLFRTYRQFQRRRQRGQVSVSLADEQA